MWCHRVKSSWASCLVWTRVLMSLTEPLSDWDSSIWKHLSFCLWVCGFCCKTCEMIVLQQTTWEVKGRDEEPFPELSLNSQVCVHTLLPGKHCMDCVCLCCVVSSPTRSVLHVLAEGLQLSFADGRVLVEDDRAAQPLRRSAQPLCSQLLSVVLSDTEEMRIQALDNLLILYVIDETSTSTWRQIISK